jgi:hypothetical protein
LRALWLCAGLKLKVLFQALDQYRSGDRLQQIVASATLERPNGVVDAAERREHHRADRGVLRVRRIQHIEAIAARKPDVHDQGVIREPIEPGQSVAKRRRLSGGEARFLKGERYQSPEGRIGIGDENCWTTARYHAVDSLGALRHNRLQRCRGGD